MEVEFTPELEAKLDQLSKETGRPQSEYVQDAVHVYLSEMLPFRKLLDGRYDEIITGKVKPIPAEDVFRRLREKSDARRSQRGA